MRTQVPPVSCIRLFGVAWAVIADFSRTTTCEGHEVTPNPSVMFADFADLRPVHSTTPHRRDWTTPTTTIAPSNAGHHTFDKEFSSSVWDWYVVVKHVSEWMILFVMLWILHDPGEDNTSVSESEDGLRGGSGAEGDEYWEIPAEGRDYEGGRGGDDFGGPTSQLTGNGRRLDEYGTI